MKFGVEPSQAHFLLFTFEMRRCVKRFDMECIANLDIGKQKMVEL
jgi:hypothetical protein